MFEPSFIVLVDLKLAQSGVYGVCFFFFLAAKNCPSLFYYNENGGNAMHIPSLN